MFLIHRYPENHRSRYGDYVRRWRSAASKRDAGSTVTIGDEYRAELDLGDFRESEIFVSRTKHMVIVEAEHEERDDGHGLVARGFIRKYVVPEGYIIDEVEVTITEERMLTIVVPKIVKKTRNIPIKFVNKEDKIISTVWGDFKLIRKGSKKGLWQKIKEEDETECEEDKVKSEEQSEEKNKEEEGESNEEKNKEQSEEKNEGKSEEEKEDKKE